MFWRTQSIIFRLELILRIAPSARERFEGEDYILYDAGSQSYSHPRLLETVFISRGSRQRQATNASSAAESRVCLVLLSGGKRRNLDFLLV